MKKSKKIGVALSVLAIAGGIVIIPSEYTYAAEIVVSNQAEFDALPEKEEWSGSASLYLNNSPSNNTIKFIGIKTSKDINGGRALEAQGVQNAQNNTLILTDCIIVKEDTDKGTGQVFGGYAQNGSAINNTVIINGSSEIHYGVYGGDSVSGGDAIGNTVIIAGDAKIYGEDIPNGANNQYIYGGFSYIGGQTGGRVEDNTVIIRDNADISNTKIYGGFTSVSNLTDDEIANLTEENFLKKNNNISAEEYINGVRKIRSMVEAVKTEKEISDFEQKALDGMFLQKKYGRAYEYIAPFENILNGNKFLKNTGTYGLLNMKRKMGKENFAMTEDEIMKKQFPVIFIDGDKCSVAEDRGKSILIYKSGCSAYYCYPKPNVVLVDKTYVLIDERHNILFCGTQENCEEKQKEVF